jgi:excisionase family DNA binding protein
MSSENQSAEIDSATAQIARAAGIAAAEVVVERLRHRVAQPKQWFDVKEAAAYVGFNETTMCRLVREGRAPKSIKISRNARRFRREDVDAWIAAGGLLQYAAQEIRP